MKKSTLISATLVTALSAFAFAPATFASMGTMDNDSKVKEAVKEAGDAHANALKAKALADHTGKKDDRDLAHKHHKISQEKDTKAKAAVMEHEKKQKETSEE